jgi:hypothetical protein
LSAEFAIHWRKFPCGAHVGPPKTRPKRGFAHLARPVQTPGQARQAAGRVHHQEGNPVMKNLAFFAVALALSFGLMAATVVVPVGATPFIV